MGLARLFGSCLAVMLFASTPLAADTTPQREVYIPVEFSILNSSDYWSNGFRVGYKGGLTPGHFPEIHTFDRNGKEVIARKPLSLPGAYHTAVHAIAEDRNGEVVVSAEFWRSRGEMAPALCRMNRAGEVTLMARTDSFLGRALAVSPDGDIWSLGSPPVSDGGALAKLERLVMSQDCEVRAFFAVVRRAGSTQPPFYGLYRLNGSAHRWDRVNTAPGNCGGLYGIDSGSMIRRTGWRTHGWSPLSPVESASLGR
ncbi:MAG: hypothetical protein HUU41_06840 [Bryobacteraceae bacterium]|nr:hypothetical protein [Bryobacterales bacterium]MEB2362770.1 hypothetical protein [Bryobacterales bacterium]NUN00813.1 hypothetical protein [Bryobacteraceae bacterium]